MSIIIASPGAAGCQAHCVCLQIQRKKKSRRKTVGFEPVTSHFKIMWLTTRPIRPMNPDTNGNYYRSRCRRQADCQQNWVRQWSRQSGLMEGLLLWRAGGEDPLKVQSRRRYRTSKGWSRRKGAGPLQQLSPLKAWRSDLKLLPLQATTRQIWS